MWFFSVKSKVGLGYICMYVVDLIFCTAMYSCVLFYGHDTVRSLGYTVTILSREKCMRYTVVSVVQKFLSFIGREVSHGARGM